MYLGIRMMFAGFVLLGLATFFVLNNFVTQIRPGIREATEELMVDTAHLLAELAADDLAAGQIANGRFAEHAKSYRERSVNAPIWGIAKETLDLRVLVTDGAGIVRFDSEGEDVGRDYSRWRDVALTLRGEYGARASREQPGKYGPPVFYVSAPIHAPGSSATSPDAAARPLIGVLSVGKPMDSIEPFIERSQSRMLKSGGWLLFWSLLVGAGITVWTVYEVRRLAHYAEAVNAGERVEAPRIRGELGKLARAMQSMRERLEGQQYVERYVTALTHELKSPLAAIRASGELLHEPMADADRQRFAGHVVSQSERMQQSVDRLLALTRLEQTQRLDEARATDLGALLQDVATRLRPRAELANVRLEVAPLPAEPLIAVVDAGLIGLALANLIENAIAFSPSGAVVRLELCKNDGDSPLRIEFAVTDEGAGIAPEMMSRLGERFLSTPRPNGAPRSSGLGLAIVKQVMALHHGELSLTSAGSGQGTQARLRLPA